MTNETPLIEHPNRNISNISYCQYICEGILLAEKNLEKEIEEMKKRLAKVEQHIGLCEEHEESEAHGEEHERKKKKAKMKP